MRSKMLMLGAVLLMSGRVWAQARVGVLDGNGQLVMSPKAFNPQALKLSGWSEPLASLSDFMRNPLNLFGASLEFKQAWAVAGQIASAFDATSPASGSPYERNRAAMAPLLRALGDDPALRRDMLTIAYSQEKLTRIANALLATRDRAAGSPDFLLPFKNARALIDNKGNPEPEDAESLKQRIRTMELLDYELRPYSFYGGIVDETRRALEQKLGDLRSQWLKANVHETAERLQDAPPPNDEPPARRLSRESPVVAAPKDESKPRPALRKPTRRREQAKDSLENASLPDDPWMAGAIIMKRLLDVLPAGYEDIPGLSSLGGVGRPIRIFMGRIVDKKTGEQILGLSLKTGEPLSVQFYASPHKNKLLKVIGGLGMKFSIESDVAEPGAGPEAARLDQENRNPGPRGKTAAANPQEEMLVKVGKAVRSYLSPLLGKLHFYLDRGADPWGEKNALMFSIWDASGKILAAGYLGHLEQAGKIVITFANNLDWRGERLRLGLQRLGLGLEYDYEDKTLATFSLAERKREEEARSWEAVTPELVARTVLAELERQHPGRFEYQVSPTGTSEVWDRESSVVFLAVSYQTDQDLVAEFRNGRPEMRVLDALFRRGMKVRHGHVRNHPYISTRGRPMP